MPYMNNARVMTSMMPRMFESNQLVKAIAGSTPWVWSPMGSGYR